MKSLFLPAIPNDKYKLIMELLKQLNVPAVEDKNQAFTLTDEHKKFIDYNLQHYLNNPDDVLDFDKAMKDIENEL